MCNRYASPFFRIYRATGGELFERLLEFGKIAEKDAVSFWIKRCGGIYAFDASMHNNMQGCCCVRVRCALKHV